MNNKLTLTQSLFQTIQVHLNVPSDRMPRRKIFRLDLRAATRTINLHYPHPKGVRRKNEFTRDQRRMNFPRVAVVQQTALLVVLPRRTDFMSTTVTQPPLLLNIQIQVFRDPYAALLFGCHRVPHATFLVPLIARVESAPCIGLSTRAGLGMALRICARSSSIVALSAETPVLASQLARRFPPSPIVASGNSTAIAALPGTETSTSIEYSIPSGLIPSPSKSRKLSALMS